MEQRVSLDIAVVGAGFQGAQIAFRSAVSGHRVSIYDVAPPAVAQALEKMAQWASEWVAAGKLTPAEAASMSDRVRAAISLADCLGQAGLIIESVPENLELKQSVWEQIDRLAPPDALLGTNSSSFKSSQVGERVARKALTFNVNFGKSVNDDMVEVMWNSHTSEATKELVRSWLLSTDMVYVETKQEIKGFSFNRVWRAIKKECLFLVDKGYSDPQDIDRAFILSLGAELGPFQLMDIIGLDVVRDIEQSYYEESSKPDDRPPTLLHAMIADGRLGVKAGRGFYTYPNPEYERPGWLHKRDQDSLA